jgi:hypothetical protein
MNAPGLQRRFAAAIRDPDSADLLPGIAPERMALYRSLVHDNIEGLLAAGFPVLRRVLGEPRWQRLTRAFTGEHRCRTPYFHQVGQAFIDWLSQGRGTAADYPPFVPELAHYERIELELEISEAGLPGRGWSELALPLAYTWPVHRISAGHQPASPPDAPTCLLAWRDRDEQVRFMELSPFAYRLALRLRAGEDSDAALLALADEAGLAADASYCRNARMLLESWRQKHIHV